MEEYGGREETAYLNSASSALSLRRVSGEPNQIDPVSLRGDGWNEGPTGATLIGNGAADAGSNDLDGGEPDSPDED